MSHRTFGALRIAIAAGLVASASVAVVLVPAGVASAEGYVDFPDTEDRVFYMAMTPNNLPGSGLIPYPVAVPQGVLLFDGADDPITGFERSLEVDTTENAATCDASRANTPPSYSGCSFVKLNVSHGDLRIGGAIPAEFPAHTEHSGGAFVQTTIDNDEASNGNDAFELYIRGLESEINAALAELSYDPVDGYYHTGGSNEIESLDITLSTAQGSISGSSSRKIYLRVMDVNDWPEVTAPGDVTIAAATNVAFGDAPVTPEDNTLYTGTRFHTTDGDNDDGTQEDADDEGSDPMQDGPFDDLLVAMWSTCGSFEITNKNTFAVSEHLGDVIDDHFDSLYDSTTLQNPLFEAAIDAAKVAVDDALTAAGLDDTLLATQSEFSNERVGAFVGLANDLPGVLDAFDEVTFFAREPGPSNAGAYIEGTTCDLYALVSDLGNNGLPIASAGFFEYYTGTYDVVAPWIGFDFDSVSIEIEEGEEIDISFDTSDPLYIAEGDDAEAYLVIDAPPDHPGFEIDWGISPRVGDPIVVGVATANSDFMGTYGNTITVPPGANMIPFDPALTPPNVNSYPDFDAEGNETLTLELDLTVAAPPPGYTIISTTPTRTVVIVDDDDDDATVTTFADASSPEGDPGDTNSIEFTIELGQPADGGEVIDVALTDGTATTPADYGTAVPTSIVFEPGQMSAAIEVPVVGDLLDEGNHSFTVTLTNPTDDLTMTDSTATGTIVDDDATRTITVADVSIVEGDPPDTSGLVFTLLLDQPAKGTESVMVATADVTATAGVDYGAVSQVVTFAPGVPSAQVSVTIVGDLDVEGDETFELEFSSATNVNAPAGPATGTITDDDPPALLEVADVTVNEDVGVATIAISSSDPTRDCQVTLMTADGTAVAPGDYASIAGTQFGVNGVDGAGITIMDDQVVESDETFSVIIVPMVDTDPGCVIADGTGVVTIVSDDQWADVSIADALVTEETGDVDETTISMTNWVPLLACDLTLTFVSGTAAAPGDYAVPPPGVFTLGGPSDVLGFTIVDDGDDDDGESFTVELTLVADGDPRCRLADDTATITIVDNDGTPDTTAPTVTIDQAAGQADPTSSSPILFTVVFSEPVVGFTTGDVTLSGTAGATTAVVTNSGDDMEFEVAVSGMTGAGTVIAAVGPSVATDLAANPNVASTSTDNEVTYTVDEPDIAPPAVTIDQAAAQADPATVGPIHFTVVFDEPVIGFTTGDVILTGTAGATTAVVTNSGDDMEFDVAVSGMTGPGTVIATVDASVATDLAGNPNESSTSTDNVVTYDPPVDEPDVTAPTVTIDQAAGQADPTSASPILFTVVFSEPVTGFESGDVALTGTAGATTAVVSGSGPMYTVSVSGMTGAGTVIASVTAGAATDAALNASTASTSTDNVVTYAPLVDAPLTIAAPADITVNNDPGQAGAVVSYPSPTTTGGVLPIDVSCNLPSGGFYPLGVTTVTCTATDGAGAEALAEVTVTDTFTITVVDNEPPVIAQPPDLALSAATASGTVVTFPLPSATDNAGPPTVTCSPASGTTFPLGVTTVTCTATDAAGNSASASFTVTVTGPVGTLPPTGGDTRTIPLVATVLLLAGLLALTLDRRQRRPGTE